MDNPTRELTKEEQLKRRDAERQDRLASHSDGAGHGLIQGNAMDKHIVMRCLYNKAEELRRHALGVERLAQLVGAASEQDYNLFSYVLEMFNRR